MRVKLIVEYDGTEFCGFQTQGKGERTVQSVLEGALSSIYARPMTFHTAGRTDTGVHALGQVISFDIDDHVPVQRLAIAMNSLLPSDVAIRAAVEAPPEFHARFSAKARTYAYVVWTRPTRSAMWDRYSLHIRKPLDVEAMRGAAARLVGVHDFESFRRRGGDPGPTTVRDLRRLSIRRMSSDRLVILATANGFLRSMVRNITGALILVGRGELSGEGVEAILAAKDRTLNPCAPAAPRGLCLLRVDY